MKVNTAPLIDAAYELLARRGDGKRHTVAAAASTKSGKVFTALNFSHFTGGPCAEIALLARLAPDGEVPVTIVAVGDQGRGVIAPCGRCRQVLLDYFPDVSIVMSGSGGIKRARYLLPDAYVWFEQQPISKTEFVTDERKKI